MPTPADAPPAASQHDRRILIVDDEPRNVLLLQRMLEAAGYTRVLSTTDPTRVLPLCREADPDLLVLDLHMPGTDGIELMRVIAHQPKRQLYLPILVLTADATERAKQEALSAGAHDFLTKPFSIAEVLLRIRNLLETRALYLELERQNLDLAERVEERTRELEETRIEVMERLCQAVEFRDDVTGKHTRRVGERSARLAAVLGLPDADVDLIRRAAPLHDVGKIAVPDAILMKDGKLTAEEFEVMRRHTVVGGRILGGGQSELMRTAESIAVAHHERWDGAGYPHGVRGEEIPMAARIVAVADVYDALTTSRPYRKPLTSDGAIREIRAGSGSHFDPVVVEGFLQMTVETPWTGDRSVIDD